MFLTVNKLHEIRRTLNRRYNLIVYFDHRPRGMLNRRYNNEEFRLEFPAGVTACDMGAITIWCEPFFATFSRITVPRTLFVSLPKCVILLVCSNYKYNLMSC